MDMHCTMNTQKATNDIKNFTCPKPYANFIHFSLELKYEPSCFTLKLSSIVNSLCNLDSLTNQVKHKQQCILLPDISLIELV